MPMLKPDGEIAHKVVVLGTRGAATYLLEQRPAHWTANGWQRRDNLCGVGEPPIDLASFNAHFDFSNGRHHVYFFGHSMAPSDLSRLGPQTLKAMLVRADHVVIVLDGASTGIQREFLDVVFDILDDHAAQVWLVGIRGYTTNDATCADKILAHGGVNVLKEASVADCLATFAAHFGRHTAPATDKAPEPLATIVATNLERFQLEALEAPWEILLSPIWERGPTGNAVRRLFVAPRSMRAHYYEGAALDLLRHPRLHEVIGVLGEREHPHHPLAMLTDLYRDTEAPFIEVAKTWTPEIGGTSLLAADAARRARVGASLEQLLTGDLTLEQSAALHRIEHDYATACNTMPVEGLVTAMRRINGQHTTTHNKPWWKFW